MPHTAGEIFGCGMTDTETEELLNALTAIGNIDIAIYGNIPIGIDIRNDIAARRHASLADNRTVITARTARTDDRTAIHRIAKRVGNRVEGRGGKIVTLDTRIRIGKRVAISRGGSDETIYSLDIIIGKTVFTI